MKAYEVTENRRQEPCNRNLRTESLIVKVLDSVYHSNRCAQGIGLKGHRCLWAFTKL